MSVIQLMVTIIIVTILVTVILGVVSYVAYWLRRIRRPTSADEVDLDPRFFYRHVPEEPVTELLSEEEPDAEEVADAVEPAAAGAKPPLVSR